ncbi:MAG: alginate export family protein [Halopseudomonas sp.]
MPASALSIHDEEGAQLNFDVEAIVGSFHSDKSYAQLNADDERSDWQEAYIKLGLSGNKALGEKGSEVFGGVSVLAGGTFGDGDAAGFTTGDEFETDLEDAYIGWRSGNLIEALGENGLEISVGRQNLAIGDGFLINGDALNFGEGFEQIPGSPDFNRGGAYWLAARKAFDQTVVLRVGGDSGARGDLFWLESDNASQGMMELAGINLEYVTEQGTLAAAYIEGLGVDAETADFLDLTHRDGQETLSLRAQGNAGVENLFLSTEWVTQDQGDTTRPDADAYYVEAGWTFADVAWSPSLNYRYSTFDTGFDPLFFGFNRGYGTWFQGEVASNFAGPFNSDTDVHHIALKVAPSETLTFGALFFDFNDTDSGAGTLDAQEIDLYAEWVVNDHLIISPLIGFYSPDNSTLSGGGSQIGNADTNTYGQIIAIIPF